MTTDLHEAALQCVQTCETVDKIAISRHVSREYLAGNLNVDPSSKPATAVDVGYPASLKLVAPGLVKSRGIGSQHGLVALIHSLAHIEFNAINLAWDAVYRFRDVPEAFYGDWVKVAAEETYHFEMLTTHLAELGSSYGALPAHTGLWEMAESTSADLPARMALVPRVLEARGLDVSPKLIERLQSAAHHRAADILRIILRDEIGHVAIGSRWFEWACHQQGKNPFDYFPVLVERYMKGPIKGPFNRQARLEAGFSDREIDRLDQSWISALEASRRRNG